MRNKLIAIAVIIICANSSAQIVISQPPSGASVNYASSQLVFVSKGANATNDRTGLSKYDATRPFATLAAAQSAASSGDTIWVMPGVYSEHTLGKDGVNWYFCQGAAIEVTANVSESRYLFTDGGSAMTYTVAGRGRFVNTDSTNPQSGAFYLAALHVSNPASSVVFEADEMIVGLSNPAIESIGYGVLVEDGLNVTVRARKISPGSLKGGAVAVVEIQEDVDISANQIFADGDVTAIISYASSEIYIRANLIRTISGASDTISGEGTGLFVVDAQNIESLGNGQPVHAQNTGSKMLVKSQRIYAASQPAIFGAGTMSVSALEIESGSGASEAVMISSDAVNVQLTGRIKATGASANCVSAHPSGVWSLTNAVLVAGASGNSIVRLGATGTAVVNVYSAVANKSVGANVTQQVGTVTVNSNVQ